MASVSRSFGAARGMGEEIRGIALWIGAGTEGFFSNLRVWPSGN
jgi:hypothetical protein